MNQISDNIFFPLSQLVKMKFPSRWYVYLSQLGMWVMSHVILDFQASRHQRNYRWTFSQHLMYQLVCFSAGFSWACFSGHHGATGGSDRRLATSSRLHVSWSWPIVKGLSQAWTIVNYLNNCSLLFRYLAYLSRVVLFGSKYRETNNLWIIQYRHLHT